MKINISALLAADGALFREQQVQLVLQELELFVLAQSHLVALRKVFLEVRGRCLGGR